MMLPTLYFNIFKQTVSFPVYKFRVKCEQASNCLFVQ